MYYLSMLVHYSVQYMKTRMSYRGDLLVELFSDLLYQGVNLVFILVVFGHIPTLNGWSREELIFIYGFFLIPYSIHSAFFDIWDFNERYIVRGEMDRILTRPIHSLFQVILESMRLEPLFGVVTGTVIMLYSGSRLGVELAWYDPFLLVAMILGGALIYGGIFVALASISFWTDSRTDIIPMIYNFSNYGRYPVDIYHPLIRFVLTFLLPFAFVGVYPAAYFLGKEEWLIFSLLTPAVGLLCFAISVVIWNRGVRRYRGAGS